MALNTHSNRIGDHIWWISNVGKFKSHYPNWRYKYDLNALLHEIHDAVTAQESITPVAIEAP